MQLKDIQQTSQYKRANEYEKSRMHKKMHRLRLKLQVDREKLATQRDIADKNLQIARENKNKYDEKKVNL